ncbi:MAG: alpha/beta hydrolase [Oligoflexia bacterium]|nr:alpha/beta hydrolase [Oligoflexia bacterium]
MFPTRTHLLLCFILGVPLTLAVLPACSLSKVAARRIQHDARHHGLQEYRTVLGARQVHFWMGGSGPPLVLVHGFGGDGLTTWAKQIDILSQTHTLIIPDLLWFGDSTAVGLEPTLDLQVDTMMDLLDQLHVARFDIAGISYGGFVALLLSQRYADRVDHVVIVDSPGPVFDAADQQAMNQRLGVDDPADVFVPQTPQDVGRLLSLVRPHGPAIPRFVLRDIQRAYFLCDQDQHRALLTNLESVPARELAGAPARAGDLGQQGPGLSPV